MFSINGENSPRTVSHRVRLWNMEPKINHYKGCNDVRLGLCYPILGITNAKNVSTCYHWFTAEKSTFYKMKWEHFNSSFNTYFQFCSSRLELFKGIFFKGFQFRMEKKNCLMHWGLSTIMFLLLRDYTLLFTKIGFFTMSTPIPPGLKAAIS